MMDLWYRITDLLPFTWLQHMFMKNALMAILIVTPIFGVVGTMVVNNRMAFFADSLGHSALTGIAIGVILGIKNPVWSLIGFALLFSAAILAVKNGSKTSTDTVIGVFSSMAVALGIVILSRGGGFNKYSTYLIGDLLSITPGEIRMLGLVFIAAIIIWYFSFNKLLLVSINESLAKSRGVKTYLLEIIFTALVAVIVTISIQWIGLLIINSLLVLPAAGARNIAASARQYHGYSVAISLFSGIIGLILSYYWGTATGATIILVSASFFFITFFLRKRIN
ncbi:MAG: metal ABC transporter permease [Firmicutes bacterium]|nr:metal ABC transporter permease [Bacillota bacterium]